MLNFKPEFYGKLFGSLENNAVLMRVEEDGTYYPVWCSAEFTDMMEGTEEEFIALESGGSMSTIHPMTGKRSRIFSGTMPQRTAPTVSPYASGL